MHTYFLQLYFTGTPNCATARDKGEPAGKSFALPLYTNLVIDKVVIVVVVERVDDDDNSEDENSGTCTTKQSAVETNIIVTTIRNVTTNELKLFN